MIVKLADNTYYILKKNEHLTFGEVGVYIWGDKEKEEYPPNRFYVYGFVREIIR